MPKYWIFTLEKNHRNQPVLVQLLERRTKELALMVFANMQCANLFDLGFCAIDRSFVKSYFLALFS